MLNGINDPPISPHARVENASNIWDEQQSDGQPVAEHME